MADTTISHIEALAEKISTHLRGMENSNVPPYEAEPVNLTRGELQVIFTALYLLRAVRFALK